MKPDPPVWRTLLYVPVRRTRSDEEVAYARKVIAADDEAKQQGRGSFAIDGKMIDIPIVVRAQRLLVRRQAIEARGEDARSHGQVGLF